MGTNALMNVKLQGKLLNLHLKHTHRTSENQFHNFFGRWRSWRMEKDNLQENFFTEKCQSAAGVLPLRGNGG